MSYLWAKIFFHKIAFYSLYKLFTLSFQGANMFGLYVVVVFIIVYKFLTAVSILALKLQNQLLVIYTPNIFDI